MSTRTLVIIVVVWAAVLWLMTTPLGGMVGFFAGIAIAYFLVPMTIILGIPEVALVPVLWGLAIAYAALVLLILVRAVLHWRRGKPAFAREALAGALSLAAIPLALWLASEALVRAWP